LVTAVSARDLFPRRCNHRNRVCFRNNTIVPNLYVYGVDDFNRYFKQANSEYSLKAISNDLERNASGTAIYIRELTSDKDFLISKAAGVRVFDRPKGYKVIDDKGEVREIQYKKDRDSENSHFLSDLSGEYFLSCNGRMANVELRSVADPDKPLARSNLSAQKILFIDGKVYLFGLDKSSFKKNGDIRHVVCQIFKRTGTGLELESEIRIPCWCHVIDVDPLTKNVVLQEGRDPPFSSIFRVFNLDSRTMRKIHFDNHPGYLLFLREDILGIAK
jgi:hypothetical protein